MTLERQDIDQDFYQADLKNIQFTVYNQNGTLKDLALSEITWALIFDDGKNPRTLFQKSSLDIYQIEVAGLGICVVHILPGDTFNIYGTFRHQLHVQDENGYAGIVSSGKVQIFRSFARRPRSTSQDAYLSA